MYQWDGEETFYFKEFGLNTIGLKFLTKGPSPLNLHKIKRILSQVHSKEIKKKVTSASAKYTGRAILRYSPRLKIATGCFSYCDCVSQAT